MDTLFVQAVAWLTPKKGELGQVDLGVKTFIMMVPQGFCYQLPD